MKICLWRELPKKVSNFIKFLRIGKMPESSTSSTTGQESSHLVTFADPLLECLVILTKLYHNPHSAEALKAGLPLVNYRFTPELFIRAAKRAHLSVRLLKQSLKTIPTLDLPVALLLKDGQACIFLKYINKKKQRVQIILPNAGESTLELSLKELQTNYSGYVFFVRPKLTFDTRTTDDATPRSRYWFWGTLLGSWALYGEIAIASLLINLFALAAPLFVMNVYDRVVPNQAIETLWVLAIGAGIVFSFDFLIRSLRGYFIDIASKKSDMLLSSTIFEHVLATQRASHPRSIGVFANHLHEFEAFREFFTSATLTAFIDLPFTLLFIFVIWSLANTLAFIPLTVIPAVIVASLLIQIPLRWIIQKTCRAGAQKQALLVETLSGIETIKTTSAEGVMQRRWEQLVSDIARSSLQSRFLSAFAVNFALFLQQMTTIVVVVVGVYLIIENKLTVGGLIACTILTGRALAPLAQIATLLTRYHQSSAALRSLNQIMNMPLERPQNRQFLQRSPLQGQIEFKQVDFCYPHQTVATLKQVSFHIQAGERVGIIGRIGSGKSTLAKLILGLYQPDGGNILLDDVDNRQRDPVEVRRYIGYVSQEVELFFGTVRDNIVMGAPYVEDEVILQAAQLAGVTEFISQHPLGFDLPIGERGAGLSGGQRQTIALARALLLNPPLLLLDEPTNAMDNRAEELFKARLFPYLEGKTLLLITHRMSLLSLVDRLIVLDEGKVVAIGKKDEVLQALAGR